MTARELVIKTHSTTRLCHASRGTCGCRWARGHVIPTNWPIEPPFPQRHPSTRQVSPPTDRRTSAKAAVKPANRPILGLRLEAGRRRQVDASRAASPNDATKAGGLRAATGLLDGRALRQGGQDLPDDPPVRVGLDGDPAFRSAAIPARQRSGVGSTWPAHEAIRGLMASCTTSRAVKWSSGPRRSRRR